MATILAIETSCDETAAAVIRGGRQTLANVIASQIELHRAYGGVVPELASRRHITAIDPVVARALADAGLTLDEIDALAVTVGPGLAGSLLVGVNWAKAVAWARGLPLIGVNHLEGHLYSNWLLQSGEDADRPAAVLPAPLPDRLRRPHRTDPDGRARQLSLARATTDDAAGEAFDKGARILGLGYPGGPAIQRAAGGGTPSDYRLPRAWLGDSYDFSYSGVKTALLRATEKHGLAEPGSPQRKSQGSAPAPRTPSRPTARPVSGRHCR